MKKIISTVIFLFIITSCKQESKDVLIEDPKSPCDFVHNRNVIYKKMIILKDGKDLKTLTENKNSKEYKEYLDLFIYHEEVLIKKQEGMNFSDSSYESCPEWNEMLENCKKAFDNNVST
jgi:hypothetical protein